MQGEEHGPTWPNQSPGWEFAFLGVTCTPRARKGFVYSLLYPRMEWRESVGLVKRLGNQEGTMEPPILDSATLGLLATTTGLSSSSFQTCFFCVGERRSGRARSGAAWHRCGLFPLCLTAAFWQQKWDSIHSIPNQSTKAIHPTAMYHLPKNPAWAARRRWQSRKRNCFLRPKRRWEKWDLAGCWPCFAESPPLLVDLFPPPFVG